MIKKNKTIIIAEAGVNHNGSLKLAKELISKASDCGADIIKFQTFIASELVTKDAKKAKYQNKNDKNKNQYKMLKKLELSHSDIIKLKKYSNKKNIEFLSSPFDFKSVDFLISLKLQRIKIPSSELNNYPLLKHISQFKKKIILSTGMGNMIEIKKALEVIMKGGINKKNITVLHCNTEYPTPFKDVNLRAMLTIKDKLKVNIGYSDHTKGIEVAIAAVALGASIIEKHFTIDRKLSGPDHQASCEPNEFKKMVVSIRNIENSLGSDIKKPTKSELKNILISRKSIVAKKIIKKNEIFTKENLSIKRPGTGISPIYFDKILGLRSNKNYKEDQMISLKGINL